MCSISWKLGIICICCKWPFYTQLMWIHFLFHLCCWFWFIPISYPTSVMSTPISFPRTGNDVDIGINASWCESRAHGKQFDYSWPNSSKLGTLRESSNLRYNYLYLIVNKIRNILAGVLWSQILAPRWSMLYILKLRTF